MWTLSGSGSPSGSYRGIPTSINVNLDIDRVNLDFFKSYYVFSPLALLLIGSNENAYLVHVYSRNISFSTTRLRGNHS